MNRTVFISAMGGLHFFTAFLLLCSAEPMHVTAVASLAVVLGSNQYLLSGFYAFAAGLALFREYRTLPKTRVSAGWFFPQFFILVCAGIGALVCIYAGRYADGVPRSVAFIARDQIIYPILALLYYRSIAHV